MRTMDWWLLTFVLGAILSLFFPLAPDIFYLSLFFVLALASIRYKALRGLLPLLLGFCWLVYCAEQYQNSWQANNLNPIALAKQRQQLNGQIVTIPRISGSINRFNFSIVKINDQLLARPLIARLRWDNPPEMLAQGQQHQLLAKIKPAHGLANPGGFSYQTWLRQKHIVASGYVLNKQSNRLLDTRQSMRQRLFNQYHHLLPQHPLAPLLLALSFGERHGIEQTAWQVLQATGTQHLIAISGLHLGLIASMSFIFFALIARLIPLGSPAENVAHGLLMASNLRTLVMFFSLSAALGYAYLAGFSLPTVRALVMLLLYWLTRLLGIRFSVKRWLLFALFILMLITPFALLSASFWLSVYAVSIIFLVLWRFSRTLQSGRTLSQKIRALLIIQLSLTVFLMPISALVYGKISLAALPANLVAVPVMSLITIPLCLLSVLSLTISDTLAGLFMGLALQSLSILWLWLEFLSQQGWALLSLSRQQTHILTLVVVLLATKTFLSATLLQSTIFSSLAVYCRRYYLAVYNRAVYNKAKNEAVNSGQTGHLVLLSAKHRIIWLLLISGFALSLTLLALVRQNKVLPAFTKPWQVLVFDVGQGLSVAIKQGKHLILYDTGAAYPSGFNMADSVILPYLQQQNIGQLEKLIISHSDNDHAGGLSILRNNLVLDQLVANDPTLNGNAACLRGDDFTWQGLSFRVLWPKESKGRKNDHSCVIQISDGKNRVLLTGDISSRVERKLLGSGIKSDLMIAPHHGSKSSSDVAFLQAVAPQYAIFSAGFLNQWSMPSEEVIQRYQQVGIKTFTTAKSGMITIELDASGIEITQYRRHSWPFWFAN